MPREASPDSPAVSYTPEQRQMIRNGLRIWARVAIRSYMRKHGVGSPTDGGGRGGGGMVNSPPESDGLQPE